jgi:hypothetical protein
MLGRDANCAFQKIPLDIMHIYNLSAGMKEGALEEVVCFLSMK